MQERLQQSWAVRRLEAQGGRVEVEAAGALASGLYFVQLRSEGRHVATQSVALVR